jgi:hypothetical protein
VTVRGNGYRMRQHTDLWHTLHTPDGTDLEPATPSRQETAAN